ncbi:MAG TPA: hypothetical protein VFC37_21520 [Terracidiphilus sp.]|jgi:hypothetical protein|nr:hypothetical protein [Terracidiphilus sp.]
MADAKLEIKVGNVAFLGEGAEEWLSKQLDKVLNKIPELAKASAHLAGESGSTSEKRDHATAAGSKASTTDTLAAFLKTKIATDSQTRKFLATSVWLHDAEKKERVGTSDVTQALNTHKQGKLKNASQCLSANVKSGFAVKDKKQFYVTDQGRESLDK